VAGLLVVGFVRDVAGNILEGRDTVDNHLNEQKVD
jgi:hypothetical protein